MRVATIFLTASLALFANAQTATDNQAPTTTDASSAAASSAQAEMSRCITACGLGNVDCQAKCVSVPSPNHNQANAANDCIANCPRDDTSEAGIIAFDACQTRCIQTNFLENPDSTDGAGNNGNNDGDDNSDDGNGDNSNNDNNDDGDDSNNNNNSNDDDATGTDGNQESNTDNNGSAPTETGGAAALKGSVMGVVGLMAAVLAL